MRKPLKEVRNEPFGFDVADSFFLPSNSHESFFAVTDNEKRRLQDAFRRSSAANNNISKQVQAVVRARALVLLQTITVSVFTDIILASPSVSFPCEFFLVSAF